MKREASNIVDTRYIKSRKQYRLRFRLSEDTIKVVKHAMSLTDYQYSNSQIDAICMAYVSFGYAYSALAIPPKGIPIKGPERFKIHLYPDQYETVSLALEMARDHIGTDEEALYLICKWFIGSEQLKPEPTAKAKPMLTYGPQ